MLTLALLLAACAVIVRVSRSFPPFVAPALGFAAVVLGGFSFVAVVPAGHVAVPVVFGHVQDRALPEGLNLVNPFADVQATTVRKET